MLFFDLLLLVAGGLVAKFMADVVRALKSIASSLDEIKKQTAIREKDER